MVDSIRSYTTQNRHAWNQVAADRRSLLQPPEYFAGGGITLESDEVEAAGTVAGKRLLNLQCGAANDALSWAVLGARVVGVDISEVAIEIAKEQARGADLDAEFVAADVYDLPEELLAEGFDITYSAAGITCWLPDLDAWAQAIWQTLKPGGVFLLNEHHGLWDVLVVTADGLHVQGDYFGRDAPDTEPGDPAKWVSGMSSRPDFVQFSWPLGDIITALATAGLRIRRVEEQSVPEMYLKSTEVRTPETDRIAAMIPAAYLLLATKD